jgi:hypothetical protein
MRPEAPERAAVPGLSFRRMHEAHDPEGRRPAYDGAPRRVVGAGQDSLGRHDQPFILDQHLVVIAPRSGLRWAAIRDRAAGAASIGRLQALKPRGKRRIGIRRRRRLGMTCDQQRGSQGNAPHASRSARVRSSRQARFGLAMFQNYSPHEKRREPRPALSRPSPMSCVAQPCRDKPAARCHIGVTGSLQVRISSVRQHPGAAYRFSVAT